MQEVKNAVKLRERNIAGMPTYMQNSNGIPHFRNLTSLDEDVFYKIQSVYLGMVAYTDWIFGQLVEGIDKAPDHLANRTVIFFSSDHGACEGNSFSRCSISPPLTLPWAWLTVPDTRRAPAP